MPNAERNKTLGHWVHWSLLAGVTASGLLLASGLLRDPGRGLTEPDHEAPTIKALLRDAAQGDGVSLINLGLLLLMATPVLRVAVLGIGWQAKGDRRFAAVALVVLLLLVLSFMLGVG